MNLFYNQEALKETTLTAFGDSLWPLVRHGAILKIQTLSREDLREGDLLVYRAENTMVCHRALKLKSIADVSFILFKGDAKPFSDGWVPFEKVLGKVASVDGTKVNSLRFSIPSRFFFYHSKAYFMVSNFIFASHWGAAIGRIRKRLLTDAPIFSNAFWILSTPWMLCKHLRNLVSHPFVFFQHLFYRVLFRLTRTVVYRSTCRVPLKKQIIALTFDDGPDPEYTPKVLEMLAKHKIKSTFFMTGENIRAYPQVARAVLSAGHEIGNHSFSHAVMLFKPSSVLLREIEKTDLLIRQLGYEKEILFRPPYGLGFITLSFVLFKQKRSCILFDLKLPQPGSIMLLHDGGKDKIRTLNTLNHLLVELKEKGFTFDCVSQLLECRSSKTKSGRESRTGVFCQSPQTL